MSLENWMHLFKPEARSKGQNFVRKDKVSSPRPSDTEVQIFVRDSSGAKVTLRSASVDSDTLNADCSCALSKKGQYCKHIWAALLTIEEKNPDFLDSKMELVKAPAVSDDKPRGLKPNRAQTASQEAYKLKQKDYRKQQYQKQKQRMRDKKSSDKKEQPEILNFPSEVEEALKYFLNNGFPLGDSLTKEAVSTAKKQLSRVFHPDKGGSHDEILELNNYARILENHLKY